MRFISIFVCLLISLISCDRFPRDPSHTLHKVKGNVLKVGVTENPPFIIFQEKEIGGSEAEMIKNFAQELNAKVEWQKGSEEVILTLLQSGELDLCAGGFASSSPWKKHVYFVKHKTLKYHWGVPAGNNVPEEIEGKKVTVKRGSAIATFVKKEGAQPEPADSISTKYELVAGEFEELKQLGFHTSKEPFKKEKISLAIQKGENAFLEKLNRFINEQRRKN